MAGHSHWAGIKHKKGRQDKVRSNLFSKLSREITVAAKLGAKDPDSNPRLRSAIQAAKQCNMPKDNIERAINKSETALDKNYENIRYEGFGPFNVAFIIESLTNNTNRTSSSIRTTLQKSGGRLGESGSTKHLFFSCGVIKISKDKISDEKIFEISIDAGAKDCFSSTNFHEIVCEKESFYKVKSEVEKKIDEFLYSGIEWRPFNKLYISAEQGEKINQILESFDDNDDVQNVFSNFVIK
tara:strand:+ start:65 stop:784 length:720 start_codon:yes stop_codon:yes gene_type:complete